MSNGFQTPLGRTAQRLGQQQQYGTKTGGLTTPMAILGGAALGPFVNYLFRPDPPKQEIPPPDILGSAMQMRQAKMQEAMMPIALPPMQAPQLQQPMPSGMLAQLAMQQAQQMPPRYRPRFGPTGMMA